MSVFHEQRICVKFCVKVGKSIIETFEMLEIAFGEEAMCRTQTYEWWKRFKEGRTSVDTDPRSGRPSTSKTDDNVAKVRELIRSNRSLTVREVAEEVSISKTVCHEILTENLGMHRIAAKFVPRLLTGDQKQNRVDVSQELLDRANDDDNFLENIITGDETWVYGYDVETKVQSSQWVSKTSPRPKKARKVRSHVKVMLKVFFDSEGVVHYKFLPQGRTVNKEYYLEVMQRLHEAVKKKRPDAWRENRWMLQHDNAPAHSSFVVRDFLAKHATTVLPQPPYSPDLAPADFFLFPKLKSTLKGRRFESIEAIKTNSLAHLRSIPKTAFRKCFRTLKKRWQRCIQSRGEYFEGDKAE